MRILFLTAHLPFPPFSGGRRREFELISRLGKDFEIYLCSITKTWETDRTYISNLLCYCASVKLFKAVSNDNKQYALYPNQIKRHTSKEASSYISFSLKNKLFDVVHVEGYYLMQHLPIKSEIPVLLVEHNIECLLNLQRVKLATIQQDKSYYWREYVDTLKWERIFWKRATKCVTLTTEDESNMRQLEPHINIRTIPNGIDHHKMIDEAASSNICKNSIVGARCPSILFVGNFLYEPNIDAALYFSQLIFPLILKDVPNAKLLLIGNAPPPEICSLALNKQIKVSGYVDSLTHFYKAADVVVCPLRIGGGVKVKVLEALNAGKAIVSTSIGVQGLDLSTYRAVTVADEVADFAEKVVRFLLDHQERYRQEQEALAYASILPTWDQATEAFVQCYKEIIDCRNR
ncbi:MAG TPA: glycosyltransferase family 4 protein [Nitrososphaeraceae archaeon]|jgi:glycosyltransferase involved in cell wall biosynthesis|nr:glycosyltransferase family 4 protein [Nitrososphaeraceae archaeon]